MARDRNKVNVRERQTEQKNGPSDNTLRIVDDEKARETIMERVRNDETEIVDLKVSRSFRVAKRARKFVSDRLS